MEIITEVVGLDKLKEMATNRFGDLVKAVVDVEREFLALDAELHADLEALLLENGSKQESLWGINLYPDMGQDDFIEFDSVINVRPSQNNRSPGVEDKDLRETITSIAKKRIKR